MCVCVSSQIVRETLAWTVPVKARRPPGFLCGDGYWCLSPPRDRCPVISHTHTRPKHTHARTHTHTILRQHTASQVLVCCGVFFQFLGHTHSHIPSHLQTCSCVLVFCGTRTQHIHKQWLVRFSHYYTVASIIAQHNDNKVMPRGDLHFVKTDTVMLLLLLLLLPRFMHHSQVVPS